MAFARTVVESGEAEKAIDAAIKGEPRLEDLYDGLKWRLARNPEVGYPVPGTHPKVYVVRSEELPGADGVIVVAYEFDNERTVIIGVRVEPLGATDNMNEQGGGT